MKGHDTGPGKYDIVVIGGGTAGLVTAAGSAGLGARVALIERDRLGGECLWTGCVPSKALIGSARIAHAFRNAGAFGIGASEPDVDAARVLESVREVRALIQPHDDPARFRAMGVDVIEGAARFASPHEVEVKGRRLRARRFVIATGSRAAVPPIEGLTEAGYYTHETAFDRDTIPQSVAIIGGGAIGIEFAQAYARLGRRVTVVEMLDEILFREEPEIAARLRVVLEAAGVRILTGRRVTRVERGADGVARLSTDGGGADAGNGEVIEAAEVLVATGRRPNVEDLDLEEAGVLVDRQGVLVDDRLRTSQNHIFAAGDVTGGYLFTHVADHEARTVVRNALFPGSARVRYDVIPWCTFTDPELAHVGLTEAEARERHGDEVRAFTYDLRQLDRAVADRAAVGCVKVLTDRRGRILGGHILAPSAGTMIVEVALAMQQGLKLDALSALVHPYPTMSEAVRRTADAYRRSLLTGWRQSLVSVALELGRRLPA
jgi:pyruvate/2-oxoglutarate dehydrogenase complex dihydrolipoamide dehydrogenase (E3) component